MSQSRLFAGETSPGNLNWSRSNVGVCPHIFCNLHISWWYSLFVQQITNITRKYVVHLHQARLFAGETSLGNLNWSRSNVGVCPHIFCNLHISWWYSLFVQQITNITRKYVVHLHQARLFAGETSLGNLNWSRSNVGVCPHIFCKQIMNITREMFIEVVP